MNAIWKSQNSRLKVLVFRLQVLHGEASVLLDGRSVPGRVFRYLDGLLYSGQQTVAALPSQGWPEALRTTDQQPYNHVGILLHALPYEPQTSKPGLAFSRPQTSVTFGQRSLEMEYMSDFAMGKTYGFFTDSYV